MPLNPVVTPAEVEQLGALSYQLFRLADQPALDSLVQLAIDFSDAWMQGHMGGGNYGLAQFPWQVTLQRRGQMCLALESLTDILKAEKVYGTHYPLQSEDAAAYEQLIEMDWGARGMQALDLWVTIEQVNRAFAMPIFSTSSPIPETDTADQSLDALSVFYSGLLDRARGQGNPNIGTVTR